MCVKRLTRAHVKVCQETECKYLLGDDFVLEESASEAKERMCLCLTACVNQYRHRVSLRTLRFGDVVRFGKNTSVTGWRSTV